MDRDTVNRLLDTNVQGEYADCPAAAIHFMMSLQIQLRQAYIEVMLLERKRDDLDAEVAPATQERW